jgi:micrococcal nuclease
MRSAERSSRRFVRVCKALCLALLFVSCRVYAEEFQGRVVGITDGDTISVINAGRAEKIRLYCPERRQAFGTRARQFTSSLAFGKEVSVRVRDKDRYGRTVADVILPDGKNLNHALVKAGYAWWFRKYAPHDRELDRLERKAREARRGLWSDPHAIPPWEFRREQSIRLQQAPVRQLSTTKLHRDSFFGFSNGP